MFTYTDEEIQGSGGNSSVSHSIQWIVNDKRMPPQCSGGYKLKVAQNNNVNKNDTCRSHMLACQTFRHRGEKLCIT